MPVRLIFTNHARVRMHERRILVEHIRAAILKPDRVQAQLNGTLKVTKLFQSERGVVVILFKGLAGNPNWHLIITAYYT